MIVFNLQFSNKTLCVFAIVSVPHFSFKCAQTHFIQLELTVI